MNVRPSALALCVHCSRLLCCSRTHPDHHVHHVGPGEPGPEQHAGRVERAVGVVGGEVAGGVAAGGAGSRPRCDHRRSRPAASVGPSRPSVPAASRVARPRRAVQRVGPRPAPAPGSGRRGPGGAAPRVTVVSPPQMKQRARSGCGMPRPSAILQQCSGYTRTGRRRLPGERRVRHHRREAQLCRPLGRSFESQAVTRDQLEGHARERLVTGLRRFGHSPRRGLAHLPARGLRDSFPEARPLEQPAARRRRWRDRGRRDPSRSRRGRRR